MTREILDIVNRMSPSELLMWETLGGDIPAGCLLDLVGEKLAYTARRHVPCHKSEPKSPAVASEPKFPARFDLNYRKQAA